MASIRKRKTKKGIKYTVLYDWEYNGVRKQKSGGTFDTEELAEVARLKIELKQKQNDMVVPDGETVREFIGRWLPIRAKNKKWAVNYLSTATGLLEKHVIPEIGNIPMQKVRPLHIENMFSNLHQKRCEGPKSYNRPDDEIPYLSGSTIGSIYTLVKCFFEAAVSWELIEKNPVKMDKPRRDESDDTAVWDLNMITTALNHIQDNQLRLMVHIAAALTCRNGEVCGLTWEMLNLDDGMMKIEKTMQRVNKKDLELLSTKEVFLVFPNAKDSSKSMLILKTPKTKGSVRWLYLTKPIIQELQQRKQEIEKNKLYYGEDYNNYDLVFCQDNGNPIEPNLLEKRFRKWQMHNENLELPHIVFHGLRHSATTLLMYLSGSDAKTVQSITGHSSAKMVFDVYNHPLMNNQQRLVQKLESAMCQDNANDCPDYATQNNDTVKSLLTAIKKDPSVLKQVFSTLLCRGCRYCGDSHSLNFR